MPDREQSVDIPGLKITLTEYHNSLKKTSTLQSLQTPATQKSRPTGTTHWEAMMKKFSQSHVETCKKLPEELETSPRDEKKFPTGSKYKGSWNALGMSGHGTYKFPNSGVTYVGEFDDGRFHGDGELRYESGAILKGKWHKGRITEKTLIFDDGLEYAENDWMYSRYPDRRYTVEINDGVEPAGRSHVTAESPSPQIHPTLYDVGDGLYDPVTKLVYQYGYTYGNITHIIRTVSTREHQWIMSNCRTSPDVSVGPCHFFYEQWMNPSLKMPVDPPPPTPTYKGHVLIKHPDRRPTDLSSVTVQSSHGFLGEPSGILFRDSGGRFDLRSSSAPAQPQDSYIMNKSPKYDGKPSIHVLPHTEKSVNVQFNRDLCATVNKNVPFASTIFSPTADSSIKKSTINW